MFKVRARERELGIAFPSSVIYPLDNLFLATVKLGYIARAAGIFRVNRIIIYNEVKNKEHTKLQDIAYDILDYISCPQYLRKIEFRLKPHLKYAGILPPLKTPNHLVEKSISKVKVNSLREGIVTRIRGELAEVELGLEKRFFLKVKGKEKVEVGKRKLFRIKDIENLEVELAGENELKDEYWCFKTEKTNLSLGEMLKKEKDTLKIGTSRLGVPFYEVKQKIRDSRTKKVLVVFGSPKRGLAEILGEEKINLYDVFDVVVNTAMNQGVATIRTEEAIFISLALINEVA